MRDRLARDGFDFVTSDHMQTLLKEVGTLGDWSFFAASWDDLHTDKYLADKGCYRKRRYAIYHTEEDGSIVREVHQPHFQLLDYNPMHGGIDRWFEPIEKTIGNGDSLLTIIEYCRQLFDALSPTLRPWHIEIHQFRIEACADQQGKPTPEGMHRDGVDYVLVLMIKRQNIASGETTIHDLHHKKVGSFTLTQTFDAAIVDDKRVYHGVTPVTPLDPQLPAHRDVLVVTFRHL